MERQYKMYHHPDMGYCAMLKTSFGWQQVSFWYTTQGRLITYWAKKNGLHYKKYVNRFTEK